MSKLTGMAPRQLAWVVSRLVCVGALLHSGAAAALSLQQAYEAALVNDPHYKGAIADNDSGKEYREIGRSGLLPNVSSSYYKNKNRTDLTQPLGNTHFTTHPVYYSSAATVQVRQALFNLDALARYKQGIAQSDYSAAQFDSRTQELVLRVVGAYIDALFAKDQVALAQVQRDTYLEQKKVNDRLYQKGEGTRTDVLETQSRLDLSEAQLLEAQDNETSARATLAGIVGQEVDNVSDMSEQFRIAPLPDEGLEALKKSAMDNNPDIRSKVLAIEAARQEINKNRAGHAPRIDFVASYSKNQSETINTYNQDTTARSLGIQISIPLYSGGAVNASTRQAVAGLEKARADLQAQTDKVVIELRKQYAAVLSSVARIRALDKAVESGKLLMQATEQSIKGGVRINLDLLNAQQQLYTSKRDLAQARYNYLLSGLKLRAAIGTLSPADVREVAGYFQ